MLQSFKMALRSIWGNKMRSFLTMLGIIIGVASVIILVSIVNGQMSYMVESFASMGMNKINVNYTALASRTIDVDEFYEFYEEHQDLFAQMSPNVSVNVTVKHGSDTMDATSVGGYSEEYLDIQGYEIAYGRNLLYSDMAARQKVAVVGAYVASELYGSSERAVGENIKLNGEPYQIVGVVEQQTEDLSDFDDGCTDDFVWIPYSRAVKMSRNAVITNYIFTSADVSQSSQCRSALEDFLLDKLKSDDFFHVTAMSELMDTLNEQIAMMSAMLGGIAGISLLVGGIGIMNIMLVSVTERTREIGLRMSIGAKGIDILAQFLIESILISVTGGLIGVVFGVGTALVVNGVAHFPIYIQPWSVILSFAVCTVTGVFFGWYPAKKAAQLDPIEAIRYE